MKPTTSISNFKLIFKDKNLLSLSVIFSFTVFSGAIRKWIITSSAVGNIILGLQLMAPTFFWYRLKNQNNGLYKGLYNSTQYYFLFLILLALNPYNKTIFHGFFGFLLHSCIWLLLLGYLKCRDKIPLEKLNLLIWITLCVQLIISGLQYNLPGDNILNLYASGEENTANVGSAIRASGTFSYLGGLLGFMVFWGFFTWYTMLSNKNIWIKLAIFISGLVCSLYTGSRSAFFYYLGLSAVGFISSKILANSVKKIIGIMMVLISLSVFSPKLSILKHIEPAWENFMKRYEKGQKSGEMDSRVNSQFLGALKYHGDDLIIGVGLGSTYQGANAVWGRSKKIIQYGYLEDEAERIVVEGGYLLYFYRLFIFIIFLKAIQIPKWSKYLIFFLFSNAMLTFNIFMGIFFALGLMWVDRAYYIKSIGDKKH